LTQGAVPSAHMCQPPPAARLQSGDHPDRLPTWGLCATCLHVPAYRRHREVTCEVSRPAARRRVLSSAASRPSWCPPLWGGNRCSAGSGWRIGVSAPGHELGQHY
jgi:hypothetical protein